MQRRRHARRVPQYVRRVLHREHTTPSQRALAHAERLTSGGKPADAIAVLNDANRAQRNRTLEQRLAELRYEAFMQSAHSPTAVAWPDVVDDQFPGALIPDIQCSELTADAVRSAITNHGSLLVRGLLDAASVARLVGAIDASLAAYDAQQTGAAQP